MRSIVILDSIQNPQGGDILLSPSPLIPLPSRERGRFLASLGMTWPATVIADLIRNPEGRIAMRCIVILDLIQNLGARMDSHGCGTMLCIVFTLTFDSSPIKGEGRFLALLGMT